MKKNSPAFIFSIWFLLIFSLATVYAEDMREIQRTVNEKKKALLEKVAEERRQAKQEAEEARRRIKADKQKLTDAVNQLSAEILSLEKENEALSARQNKLNAQESELKNRLAEVDAVIRELVGVIRSYGRDLSMLVDENLQTALAPERGQALEQLNEDEGFPGMDDIRHMVDLYFEEIRHSGEVRVEKGRMINRSGEEVSGDILVVGNFTAAYQVPHETGFLNFSSSDRHLSALSKLPPRKMRKKIQAYMAGDSRNVPMDVSRGGALRQLTHRMSFVEQIKKGGPIVWPILAILVMAAVIMCERLIFLTRKNMDAESFIGKITDLISGGNWEKCRDLCKRHPKKPLSNIILAGLEFKDMKREDMENAVQETILREIPPLEKFLSTLGMLAAIAPLLGLLGTVTGMINTFHVITCYGTGDPRMMSGGISEALVTTMLGLMVAIPIMFGHTLLSRRVENMIGTMEEKAVTFINTVYKTRASV